MSTIHLVTPRREALKIKLHFSDAKHAVEDLEAMKATLYGQEARDRNPDDSKHVIERGDNMMLYALKHGRATFFAEAGDRSNILAATFAYHAEQNYAELGSTRSVMPGFNATVPLISALSLHERQEWPSQWQVAAIGIGNIRSINTYELKNGWQRVDPAQARRLHEVTHKPIFDDEKIDGGKTPTGKKVWEAATNETFRREAANLVDAIKLGGLYNRKTGQVIEADFDELAEHGMPLAELEERARDPIVSHRALRRLNHA